MGYIIGHIFDHDAIKAMFRIGRDESLERIRRERRKDKITFRLGSGEIGGVYILSVEGKRVKEVIDAIMGFGARNVILDESGLISDGHYAGVKRMLGGHKDNFLFEIGNPFRRNHFLRIWRDPNYHHIKIPWQQGVAEGRVSEEFIDEMRKEAFFNILYDVEFPEEEAIDAKGYMPLLTEKQLELAEVKDIDLFGELRLGNDVAGGGRNYSVIVLRGENGAKVLYRRSNPDTMSFTGEILTVMKIKNVLDQNTSVDNVGVGKGVYDRLKEQKDKVNGVNFGKAPDNREEFLNKKAECYWRLKRWIETGGKLVKDSGFRELLDIKYKVQSDRKIKIKSKEEMANEGIPSPDVADALALTFAKPKTEKRKPLEQPKFIETSEYGGK